MTKIIARELITNLGQRQEADSTAKSFQPCAGSPQRLS